ncbi:hypothetical protein GW17_00009055 [Ensete ventricosum]|nr:hypothetical protein GW17_00009055 [Ensete ventricosum]
MIPTRVTLPALRRMRVHSLSGKESPRRRVLKRRDLRILPRGGDRPTLTLSSVVQAIRFPPTPRRVTPSSRNSHPNKLTTSPWVPPHPTAETVASF